jgi:hypothetical protein
VRRRLSAAKKAWLNAYTRSMRSNPEMIRKLGEVYLPIVSSRLAADGADGALDRRRAGLAELAGLVLVSVLGWSGLGVGNYGELGRPTLGGAENAPRGESLGVLTRGQRLRGRMCTGRLLGTDLSR